MKQCKAKVILGNGWKMKAGDQCPDDCIEGSEFCWTHDLTVKNGIRSEEDVREGKGNRDNQ